MNELNIILTHPVGRTVAILIMVIILAVIIYYIGKCGFFLFDKVKFFRKSVVINVAWTYFGILAAIYGDSQYANDIIYRFYKDHIPLVAQLALLILWFFAILVIILPTRESFRRNKKVEL